MQQIVKPIFIVGAPRSGTSILGRMIENHSQLVHLKDSRLLWKYGNDSKSDMLTAADARPEVAEYIKNKILQLTKDNDSPRLLDKTVNNSVRLDFIHKIFPDAKIIHIIRNGYESSVSINRHWNTAKGKGVANRHRKGSKDSVLVQRLKEIHWTQLPHYAGEFISRIFSSKNDTKPKFLYGVKMPGMKQMLEEWDTLDIAANMWRTCVQSACHYGRNHLPANQYMEVRFEELDANMLLKILEFAELQNEPGFLDYFNENYNQKEIKTSLDTLSPQQKDALDKWLVPTISWLGFKK